MWASIERRTAVHLDGILLGRIAPYLPASPSSRGLQWKVVAQARGRRETSKEKVVASREEGEEEEQEEEEEEEEEEGHDFQLEATS